MGFLSRIPYVKNEIFFEELAICLENLKEGKSPGTINKTHDGEILVDFAHFRFYNTFCMGGNILLSTPKIGYSIQERAIILEFLNASGWEKGFSLSFYPGNFELKSGEGIIWLLTGDGKPIGSLSFKN